jgi:MGT family glycosyltransferase
MKVVVLPAPEYGHVNPTLPVASELVDRGHEVTYFLPPSFDAAVTRTGASRGRLPASFGLPSPTEVVTDGQTAEERLAERLAEFVDATTEDVRGTRAVIRAVERAGPDRILYDPMAVWGRLAAAALDCRSVAFHTSFVLTAASAVVRESSPSLRTFVTPETVRSLVQFNWAVQKLRLLRGTPSLRPRDLLLATEDPAVVPMPRAFQADADRLGGRYEFVGPLVRSTADPRNVADAEGVDLDRLAGERSLYVSLGTVVRSDRAFVRTVAEAFGDTGYEVLLKTGDETVTDVSVPENVVVRERAPQLDVLDRVDAFLTHGGMNSTMEAVYHGVPTVVLPQTAEQRLVARRVAALDLGVSLADAEATPERLRAAVRRVDSDPFRERVAAFGETAREGGGAPRAADRVVARE